jgi:hypothetical protein
MPRQQLELRASYDMGPTGRERPRVKTPAETTCPSGRLLETDSGHQKPAAAWDRAGTKLHPIVRHFQRLPHRRSTRGLSHDPSSRFRRTRSENIVELMVVIPTGVGVSAGRSCPGRFSYSLLAPEFSLFRTKKFPVKAA